MTDLLVAVSVVAIGGAICTVWAFVAGKYAGYCEAIRIMRRERDR